MKDIKPPPPIDISLSLSQLGEQMAIARKAMEWRLTELADHAGISRSTLIEIEKGSPYVAIGNYFTVLWALDLLSDVDNIAGLESGSHRMMADRLPKRVRHGRKLASVSMDAGVRQRR